MITRYKKHNKVSRKINQAHKNKGKMILGLDYNQIKHEFESHVSKQESIVKQFNKKSTEDSEAIKQLKSENHELRTQIGNMNKTLNKLVSENQE